MTTPNDVFKTTIDSTVATRIYEVDELKRIVKLLDMWERVEQKND